MEEALNLSRETPSSEEDRCCGRPRTMNDIRQSEATVRRCKKDLIRRGLVDDTEVLDEEGSLVSDVFFKKDTKGCIINMYETHDNLSNTGNRGGSRAVT